MIKLDESFKEKDIINNLSFFNSLEIGFESNKFFFQ